MTQVSDVDCWDKIDPEDLWVTDKLILAKRLGYVCGPAGLKVPRAAYYVVRPCVNYRMMSRGATIEYLDCNDDSIPDGYFWCERFKGRHLSFDFNYGVQTLAVEGFRDDSERLDRFSKWTKVDDIFFVPPILQPILKKYEWVNLEVIGDNVIEVHFRYNDDFACHGSKTIIPVWKDKFYHSECGDRVGFILE
jgi:hypothetical protein